MRQAAIVTGGASGIGLAAASRLIEDGWPVAVLDANPEALLAAEDELASDVEALHSISKEIKKMKREVEKIKKDHDAE